MRLIKPIKVLGIILFLALFSACSSAPSKGTALTDYDPPAWVVKGAGAFQDDKGKAFYGVGSVTGIRNFALARTTADNRARNDLAKIFETYSKSLMKDYSASTVAGDPNVTSEEQHVEQAIKTITASTLTGVEIIDHWEHPGRGELFSLARLDLERFKDFLEKQEELSQEVRDAIKKRADTLHEELEVEVDKKE